MEKRSILAIVLSALVFILYYTFFFKAPAPLPIQPVLNSSETKKTEINVSNKAPLNLSESKPIIQTPNALISRPEQIIKFDNNLYAVDQSNLGARILSFFVKGYHQTVDTKSPLVDMFSGKPENNFLLQFQDSNFTLPAVLPYEVLSKTNSSIEFQYQQSDIIIHQFIHWDEQNYLANVKVILENKSDRFLESSVGLRLETNQHIESKQSFAFLRGPQNFIYPINYNEKGLQTHSDVKKLPATTEEKAAFEWAGMEDRYFIWALVSRALSAETKVKYGWREGGILFTEMFYPKDGAAPQGKFQKEFSIYVGPKEIDRLKQLGVHLEASVDYGWFSFVAHPILFLLKFFHTWVGNWGLAIILLTVFIKLLLHPINKKSLDSMKAMQKLQPKLTELRAKYKNDRERLNVEMMSMFKAHKVNPMGGCLPMLLQMPVYIALYKVLYNAIELYHAPFFWYYKDLSAPDPYFISPVLLGVFMVLQQKMTPNPSQDPAQANAMLMMPIIFSVFMLFLPSGLVIYIFVNTFMTVVQQYMNQHDMGFADLIKKWRKAS